MNTLQDRLLHARSTAKGNVHSLFTSFHDVLLNHYEIKSRDDIFLKYYEGSELKECITYHEAIELARKTAAYYISIGLQKGDRICTAAHNHPDTIIQYLAAWLLGLSIVPLNMTEDDQRIAFIIRDSGCKLILCRTEYITRILPCIEPTTVLLQEIDTDDSYLQLYGELIQSFDPLPFTPKQDMLNHEALIVYTSGTTGTPKAVALDQQNLLIDADCIAKWNGISNDSTMMCVLPIHHVNGIVVTHVTPLLVGGMIVLNRKFSSENFFSIIEKEQVHVVSVVPTLLSFLLQYHQVHSFKQPSSLSHIICGAGPLTCELAQSFEHTFKITVLHGYGLSETTCYSCFLPLDLPKDAHESMLSSHGFPSIGTPIPCNEMDIHDPTGRPLPEFVKGEIVIRGTNVMQGYVHNDKANEETFAYGWFRSGDEGFWMKGPQELPYFFITGRLKELIIRGGVNMAPLEIDEVICRAPGVRAGICVGFDNDVYGEEVGALIIPEHDSVQPENILEYCKSQLPFSKTPKCIIFTNELPSTSTGKYQRNKVKHLFSEYKSIHFKA